MNRDVSFIFIPVPTFGACPSLPSRPRREVESSRSHGWCRASLVKTSDRAGRLTMRAIWRISSHSLPHDPQWTDSSKCLRAACSSLRLNEEGEQLEHCCQRRCEQVARLWASLVLYAESRCQGVAQSRLSNIDEHQLAEQSFPSEAHYWLKYVQNRLSFLKSVALTHLELKFHSETRLRANWMGLGNPSSSF